MKIFVIAEKEMSRDSYGLVQRCSGVTTFKQAMNTASSHVVGRCIFSPCDESCMRTEFVYCSVDK